MFKNVLISSQCSVHITQYQNDKNIPIHSCITNSADFLIGTIMINDFDVITHDRLFQMYFDFEYDQCNSVDILNELAYIDDQYYNI